MAAPPLRVFLYAGTRELHRYLRALETILRDYRLLSIDPYLSPTDPTHASSDMLPRFPREMQEGDLLLTFSVSHRDGGVRRLEDEATKRKLVVLPFLLSRDPLPSDLSQHPFPEERFDTVLVEAHKGEATLNRVVLRTLTERVRMCDPSTDLLLRPQNQPNGSPSNPDDPLQANALQALELDGQDNPSALVQLACESRRQACIAIRARLLELAQEALQRAVANDATSALTAYWLARLNLARNIGASLENGLREATRAARLARLQKPGSPLEIASWRLAARICAIRGDQVGFREYLENSAAIEPPTIELQLETLRLYHRAGLSRDGVPLLEQLYARDRDLAALLSEDPDLTAYHLHLQGLRDRQESHLRDIIRELAKNEADVCQLRGVHPPLPPSTESDDIHADPLELLERVGRQHAAFQLGLFNAWAIDLIETTRALHELTLEHRIFAKASRAMPLRGDLDGLVERLWPRLRQRYKALRQALAETDRQEEKLSQAKAQAFAQLKQESKQFLLHTGILERLLARHPGFLKSRPDAAEPAFRDLALLDATDPLPRLDEALPEDIREILDFEHIEVPSPALYRLELTTRLPWADPNSHRRPRAASRVGVYFQEAKRKYAETEWDAS